MGIFSLFQRAVNHAEGSYCSTSGTHLDYLEGNEIDEEIVAAEDRGDSVSYGYNQFHDSAVNNRHDDDGRPIQQGPKEADEYEYADSDDYYYADIDYS